MIRRTTYRTLIALLLPLSGLPCTQAAEPRPEPATRLESTLGAMDTPTLVEWTQSLGQACARNACRGISDAVRTREALSKELRSRFAQETGESLESIDLARWTTALESRTDGERCRLLRTAFVLSLGDAADPSRPTWRLFTHERPLAALTRLGHRPGPGKSPVCPDYFFPESDVLEQAISRAERLLREAPIGAAETRSRVQALKLRYLSRGGVQRSPAG